jgi:DNA-binding NarL/FixJ family response regulator
MERISVLLADDHPVVRQGLRTLLELQDDIELVGDQLRERRTADRL